MISPKSFLIVLLTFVSIALTSCEKEPKIPALDVQFDVPEKMTINSSDMLLEFRVKFGKAPLESDVILLGSMAGQTNSCAIVDVSSKVFHAKAFDGISAGEYNVYIQRGKEKKLMGTTGITIKYESTSSLTIEPKEGMNVYGIVSCGDTPLAGVAVSDGYEVTTTDSKGCYWMASQKYHGYVFVSVPSGYMPTCEGVLPKFYQLLTKSTAAAERVDFPMTDVGDQTNHTMLFMGDMHLAARNNDRSQFAKFTADVNKYLAAHPGEKTYAMTLGDMTWDLYWISNKYAFPEYLADVNAIKGLPIFHTIGNHDHDMYAAGDFDTVIKYKQYIAPTYYSFNVGNVHYVALDDIECRNTGSGTSDGRIYDTNLTSDEIDWLKKDLANVPKTMAVVVTMHSPVYWESGSMRVGKGSQLISALSGYKEVHFVTGHTHLMYNVDKLSASKIYEHNSGAVCGTWWWSGKNVPGIHIGQDGTPGGYRVMNVSGTSFSWRFKAQEGPDNLMFRTYDGNQIDLTADTRVPNASSTGRTYYEKYSVNWNKRQSDNYVYINVWDYDSSWDVKVTENGNNLSVTKVSVYDPLHVLTYLAPSMNKASASSCTFPTTLNNHTFRVKASSATSTLEITVTDRFGNKYSETMTRPKTFDENQYKL